MANKNLLTNGAKLSSIELLYYSPVAVVPPYFAIPLGTIYCFLSKVDPWVDENNPPAPTQDQKYIKSVFKNMFVAKQIQTNNISPVVSRKDWTTGTVYDYYRDDVDMLAKDNNGLPVYSFYVKNRYDQVFKCLWNNNGGVSTNEPYFEPGTYGTNNIYQGADGYKWKFLYTIDTASKVNFLDSTWMPVPVGANTPNPLFSSAGYGSIDVINVTNSGSGYDQANAVITVTITGDGYGAAGTANVVNGQITDIIVTNPGTNYNFASVSISSSLGSGATAVSPTSPIGGHAFDHVSELGCSNAMLVCEFNGSEGGLLPTDIDFRQVGLVISPTALSASIDGTYIPASKSVYRASTDFVVASGVDTGFVQDEIVYQGPNLNNATFIATVLSFDLASNTLKLINTTGTPTTNAPVFGSSSGAARTLLTINPPDFVVGSGYISYLENRTGVQRSPDGIEQFKFVLGY